MSPWYEPWRLAVLNARILSEDWLAVASFLQGGDRDIAQLTDVQIGRINRHASYVARVRRDDQVRVVRTKAGHWEARRFPSRRGPRRNGK